MSDEAKSKDDTADEAEPEAEKPEASEPEASEPEAAEPAKPARKKKRRSTASIETEAAPAQPVKKTGMSKNTIAIAAIALGALVVGGVFLIQRASGGSKAWAVGSEVDVEITLVAGDVNNLQCASKQVVGNAHCAFEDGTRAWVKDDKAVLMPYSTVDNRSLLGAGLWTDPGIAGAKLPNGRFSVKCKLKVEGTVPKPMVRWQATGKWDETSNDWAAGTLSGCTVVTSAAPAAS